jgi:hypothetical protein
VESKEVRIVLSVIFKIKKSKYGLSTMPTKDLCNYVTKTGRIPVSVYSDKDYRELIVKPRSVLGVNRRTRIKRKPIKL